MWLMDWIFGSNKPVRLFPDRQPKEPADESILLKQMQEDRLVNEIRSTLDYAASKLETSARSQDRPV